MINSTNNLVNADDQLIQSKIITIRNMQVMIDRDLSAIYEVENKRLSEQVRRNIERSPDKFRFQLTWQEKTNWSQFATASIHSSSQQHYLMPLPSKEYLCYQQCCVAKRQSKLAFKLLKRVSMRKFITNNATVFQRLYYIEDTTINYRNHVR